MAVCNENGQPGDTQVLSPRETGSWRQAGDTVGRPGWSLLGSQPGLDPLFRDHTAQTHQLDALTLARPSEEAAAAFLSLFYRFEN